VGQGKEGSFLGGEWEWQKTQKTGQNIQFWQSFCANMKKGGRHGDRGGKRGGSNRGYLRRIENLSTVKGDGAETVTEKFKRKREKKLKRRLLGEEPQMSKK